MIRIRIYGCSKNTILKQCLTRASIFFLSELMPKKRNIEIVVRVIDDLLGKESVYGECYNYSNRMRPANYVIQIDACMKPYDILSTLAHEMVHIKQFDKRELVFFSTYSKWKGIKFDITMPYVDNPWEHEAEELETRLSNSFIIFNPEFNEFLKSNVGITLDR